MNQKPVYFSKKYRRSKMEGRKAVRRPILFSMEDSDQLATASSRVRVIQHLAKHISPDESHPRDFTAYFHSSNKNVNSSCAATSHYNKDLLPKRRVIVPAYPCTQSLRWNPFVESEPVEEESRISDKRSDKQNMRCDLRSKLDMRSDPRPESRSDPQSWSQDDEPKFNCKCENCSTKRCPSRAHIQTDRRVFRDNIMTFSDQQTMTPKLNEVGCGCARVSTPRVSDMSVTASDIAVHDTLGSMQIHRLYSPDQCPTSILKRNSLCCEEFPNYSKPHCCEHILQTNLMQEPERDFVEKIIAPSKISSIKSFFKCKKKKDCLNPRRNIYNEGISDLVADNFPISPIRVPSPIQSIKSDRSKSSVRSRCCLDEGIPFSHRSDSRYHHNCKKSNSQNFYGDNGEVRHLVTSPEVSRKVYSSRPIKFHKDPPTCVRMPKRVLTSERDIESYIDREYPKICVPVIRKARRS